MSLSLLCWNNELSAARRPRSKTGKQEPALSLPQDWESAKRAGRMVRARRGGGGRERRGKQNLRGWRRFCSRPELLRYKT